MFLCFIQNKYINMDLRQCLCKKLNQNVFTFLSSVLLMIVVITIFKPREHNHNGGGQIKILILGYPRTGSSFLGALLSASPNTSYVYEPFRFYEIYKNGSSEEIEFFLEGLFSGQVDSLQKMKKEMRARANNASLSELRNFPMVIKSIRLTIKHVMPWLLDKDNNIKVVHLIRDPRATYHSMMKQEQTWTKRLSCIETECQELEENLDLGKDLPTSRYIRVYYEELSSHLTLMPTLERLYSFMGLEFGDNERSFALKTTGADSTSTGQVQSSSQYSVNRASSFDPQKWNKSMAKEMVQLVQNMCSGFMEKAGYVKIY